MGTESSSNYQNLDKMSTEELLENINQEDHVVPQILKECIPQISPLVMEITSKINDGGRLFYIGAGTSGRLGIVDASECPPTFGVPQDMVIGIIAGGDSAIREAVEFAEDNIEQAWKDLKQHNINSNDVVIGIAASGRTPYVYGGLQACQENNITTGCIICNSNGTIKDVSDFPIIAEVGPEFVTGSTRMKAGTAQKLILNMISTATMIQLGKVVGNKMVDMQLSNKKLVDRGVKMIVSETGIDYNEASVLLNKLGSVRLAIATITNEA